MPTYEVSLIVKKLARPELISVLKRAGETILDRGGIIRKVESLGMRQLPYKMSKLGTHKEGNYFIYYCDIPPRMLVDLKDAYVRDIDVLRASFSLHGVEREQFKCTLEEELQPPAYRPSVQKLLMEAEKSKRKKTYEKYVRDGEI